MIKKIKSYIKPKISKKKIIVRMFYRFEDTFDFNGSLFAVNVCRCCGSGETGGACSENCNKC